MPKRPPSPKNSIIAGAGVDVPREPLIKLRSYQIEVFRHDLRRLFLLWARQKGKSSTLASEALDLMMATPGSLVTFISASIVLGTEVLLKEAQLWTHFLKAYRKAASSVGLILTTSADGLDLDAIADLFEHSKLETRLWHDRTTCSRSRVIAPNPDTAVGWTAHIFGDEIGRWPNAKEVFEAIKPFMASNPDLKMRLATTPPPDDKHYSFELFEPKDEFQINPLGNWYESPSGIMVHRFDVDDAYAAGFPLYHPDTGAPISPDADRALDPDKSAWDRNHRLKFLLGGTAAIPLASLARAMAAGRDLCIGANITEPVDYAEAP
jgi:hypothetical protein